MLDLAPAGEERTWEGPRGAIAFWELGEGAPVLCLHGFPDHAAGMMPVAEDLAEAGFRAIVPALPGYWPSDPVSGGDYSAGAVSEDLLGLLDHLDTGPVALIGHDWGACIGYHVGARDPGRLSHLVALGAPHPAGFELRRTVFSEQRTAWYALLLAYAPGAAAVIRDERWLTALVGSWSPGFHWAELPLIADLLSREGVGEAICAYYRADMDAALDHRPVRVPATVIYGGQDGCIRPIAYDGLERWFEAGVQLHQHGEVGHWPHLEDRAGVTAEILAALGRVPPR